MTPDRTVARVLVGNASLAAAVVLLVTVVGCRGAGSHHVAPEADAEPVEADADAEGTPDAERGPECTLELATGSECPFGDHCDTFVQPVNISGDILVVVDSSGSIDPAGDALQTNLGWFFDSLAWTDTHIHVGILSAATEGANPGVLVAAPGNPGYVNETTPNLSAVLHENLAALPPQGTGNNQALEAVRFALSEPNASGANAGFRRPDAYLAIVFVSDRDDGSMEDVSAYRDFLLSLLGDRGDYKLAAFVVAGDPGSGCNSSSIDAEPGERYQEFIDPLASRFISICGEEWGKRLPPPQSGCFCNRDQFFLSRLPDPESIEVGVGCECVPPGPWEYDEPSNSVVFEYGHFPEEGSLIVICYGPQ